MRSFGIQIPQIEIEKSLIYIEEAKRNKRKEKEKLFHTVVTHTKTTIVMDK